MSETSGPWIPIREIADWSIGGPADRPYDNPEQARADLLSLCGVVEDATSTEPEPASAASDTEVEPEN